MKQRRPGKHLGLLRCHKYDENMCIIKHLNLYVDKTKHSRDSVNSLSIYQRPDGGVTPETSPRIKPMLATREIDTSIFSAHSTRAASTLSAIDQGC